jgi:hypothetical protein
MKGQFSAKAPMEIEADRPLSEQLQATARVVRDADEAHFREPAGSRQWRRRGLLQRLSDTG